MRALRLLLALASVWLIAGCDPAPMPDDIRSLAVLPADATPIHEITLPWVGFYITHALMDDTRFKVISAEDVERLLSDPLDQALYDRFRIQSATEGDIDPPLAQALGDRLQAGGLVLPVIRLTMVGADSGKMVVALNVYEGDSGRRVWNGWRERPFNGRLGDPAFIALVGNLEGQLVSEMPRPRGELTW